MQSRGEARDGPTATRIAILLPALWVTLWGCGDASDTPADPVAPEKRTPPALVVVSLDTLRADHLPVYGYDRDTAPAISTFASDAIVFEQALAQSSGTLPSHLSLITSRYPPQLRITRRDGRNGDQMRTTLRLPDVVETVTERLRDGGYATAAFTDGAFMGARYGFDQGFDVFESNTYSDAGTRHGLAVTLPKLERFLAERAVEPSTAPLFLFIHSYDPHEPYDAAEPFERSFSEKSFRELWQQLGYRPVPSLLNRFRRSLAPDVVEAVRGLYDNGIRATDARFAELLDLLRGHDLYDEAVIAVLSDHGEEFLEHGAFNHGPTVHREIVHVPLLVRLPEGRHAGRVVPQPVALIDVAPTLLELAGLAVPEAFAGRSLLPLLADGEARAADDRAFFFESPNLVSGSRGMQRGSMKVVERFRDGAVELYDLSADPRERSDLAAERVDEAAALAAELRDWTQQLEDEGRRQGWHAQATRRALTPAERERLRALGYIE